MEKRTRGELEAEITKAVISFEKEYLGRGPLDARSFLIQDMILIRLRGVLTPAEQKLSQDREGQRLVKETRRQLFETSRAILEATIRDLTGVNVISLHTDLSTRTGERVIVFTLESNLESQFPRSGKEDDR
jgi:uncharacterized protein YbcI